MLLVDPCNREEMAARSEVEDIGTDSVSESIMWLQPFSSVSCWNEECFALDTTWSGGDLVDDLDEPWRDSVGEG